MAPYDDKVVLVSEALVLKGLQYLQVFGCIRLPSQRTLRDFNHCVSAITGFSSAVDQQLMRAADIDKCPERQKYVHSFMTRCTSKKTWFATSIVAPSMGFATLATSTSTFSSSKHRLKMILPIAMNYTHVKMMLVLM